MAGVKISIYLDIRKPLKGEKYAVKLRVYFNPKERFYPTGIKCTKEDFKLSYQSEKPRGAMRKLKDEIADIESKARTIAKDMKAFNLERFERLMFAPSGANTDIFFQYKLKIDQLKSEGQINTARSYENSLQSLTAYLASKHKFAKVTYSAITAPWLTSYEQWMEQQGNSLTTVGIYLRPLRHIFNEAVRLGIIDKDIYPFGRGKYIIPSGSNVKKALNKSQLAAIFNYKGDEYLNKARDFFFFSYVCNGINFKDISRLRYRNIQGDTLTFIREKTRRTRKGGSSPKITAILNDFAKGVIAKYGNPEKPDALIFPIINDGMTEQEKHTALDHFIRNTNKALKKLCKLAGVDRDISTYFARHSFSTMAKRSGASVEFISESLGHSNIKTTMNYLDSFDEDVKRDIAGKLMDF